MDRQRLPIGILQVIAKAAVQYTRLSMTQRGSMLPRSAPAPARLDAAQLNGCVRDEGVEHPRRVAAAADAGNDHVGQPADLLEALGFGLPPDHGLEVANHDGEWVRSDHAADDVV